MWIIQGPDHQRFADTGGAEEEFAGIQQEIADAEAAHKARMDEARAEGQTKREDILKAANATADDIVQKGQQQAKEKLTAALGTISEEKSSALGELETAVAPLADKAADKLIGEAA